MVCKKWRQGIHGVIQGVARDGTRGLLQGVSINSSTSTKGLLFSQKGSSLQVACQVRLSRETWQPTALLQPVCGEIITWQYLDWQEWQPRCAGHVFFLLVSHQPCELFCGRLFLSFWCASFRWHSGCFKIVSVSSFCPISMEEHTAS